MIIQYTEVFEDDFAKLPELLQEKCRETIASFIDAYTIRQFPKGLRVHKCGTFLSLSISMKHRIFVRPILGGIRFVFVGDHEDADRWLKKH
ncbi:MAG: hypothetical protein HY593_04590 [Candidatus Omnitrophica bacterium]|nr:hypothetical protein [Candidatus Omnitrophota bacterium]